MLKHIWTLVVIGAVSAGCPTPRDGDDRTPSADTGVVDPGPKDGGIDGGTDPGDAGVTLDGDVPDGGFVSSGQTTVEVTGGGGRAASTDYRARIIIGAPSPIGAGASADFRAVIGTGAAQAGQ